MKPIVFRLHCKEDYHLAIKLINLCEQFNINYTYDIEDVGTDYEVSSLWFVIEIKGDNNVL